MKFTGKTFLVSLCALASFNGMAAVEDFTPVSAINESGWYQIRQVVSYNKSSSVSYTAPRYLYSSNTVEPTANYTYVGTAAAPKDDATAFLYVDKGTSDYAIRTLNGFYTTAVAKQTTSRTAITVSLEDESNNAFRVGTYWDDWFDSFIGGGSGSAYAVTRFQFSKVSSETLSKYDIYSVSINGGNNSSITTNSSDNKGNATVYNGGSYFFVKGATPTAADFTPTSVAGMEAKVSVDNDQKKIVVTYLPDVFKDGSVYTITNYQQSGTHFVMCMDQTHGGLYADEVTNTHGNEKLFACHILDNGKVTFSSVATGAYLKYYGYRDNKNKGYTDGQGMTDVYDADVCDFSFVSTTSTVADTYLMYTPKRESSSTREGVVVVNSDKTFNGNGVSVAYASGYSNLFKFEKVEDFSYNKVTLQPKDGKNYASVYLTYPYTLPEGVEAYYGRAVKEDNSQITLTKIEGNVVPKQTAVVLMSESVSGEQTLIPAVCTTTTTLENKLSGTLEDETLSSDKTVYGFTGKYDEIGFYKWTGEKLPKGKAFLAFDNSSNAAQAFVLNFDNGAVTAISQVNGTDKAASNACYDLSGRRVSKPTKGVYIVNGKKMLCK